MPIFGLTSTHTVAVLALLVVLGMTCGSARGQHPAPLADDHTFLGSGPFLNNGCLLSSDLPNGEIVIQFAVTRFMGATKPDGTLLHAQELIQSGLVSRQSRLEICAWDVDFVGSVQTADYCPPGGMHNYQGAERDRVYFNGESIAGGWDNGCLSGSDGVSSVSTFFIPFDKIRFPTAPGEGGFAPTPAINEVVIRVDTLNPSDPMWCVEVAWAALSARVTSPIVFVHGNSCDGLFFAVHGVFPEMLNRGLVCDNSIWFEPNQTSVEQNAEKLSNELPLVAKRFGVNSLHLVAHSKGGLDCREFLASQYPTLRTDLHILSLTTLSTPHNGSALADLTDGYHNLRLVFGLRPDVVNLTAFQEFLAFMGRWNGGYPFLRTDYCTIRFNPRNVPLLPRDTSYMTIGADADLSGNGSIDSWSEVEGLEVDEDALGWFPQSQGVGATNAVYQILKNHKKLRLELAPAQISGHILTLRAVFTPQGDSDGRNDTLVTLSSARGEGALDGLLPNGWSISLTGSDGANHSTVGGERTAHYIYNCVLQAEFYRGDLR